MVKVWEYCRIISCDWIVIANQASKMCKAATLRILPASLSMSLGIIPNELSEHAVECFHCSKEQDSIIKLTISASCIGSSSKKLLPPSMNLLDNLSHHNLTIYW